MKINNLQHIKDLARELMDHYGLIDWNFDFCNGKQLHGKAILKQRTIAISRIHAQYEQNSEAIRDTILHEIAHALDYKERGTSNHDNHWKNIAKHIGCVPSSRGYGKSTIPFTKKELNKWIGRCPHCKEIYYRNRRQQVACRTCCKKYNGGKFSKQFLIEYIPNPDYKKI